VGNVSGVGPKPGGALRGNYREVSLWECGAKLIVSADLRRQSPAAAAHLQLLPYPPVELRQFTTDLRDLTASVLCGDPPELTASFLCRAGTPKDVAAKAEELGSSWKPVPTATAGVDVIRWDTQATPRACASLILATSPPMRLRRDLRSPETDRFGAIARAISSCRPRLFSPA
jgi:hypothetical protein